MLDVFCHSNGFSVGYVGKPKRCFIVRVPDRSEKTLLPIIQKYIRPGSIIMSDCWKAYNNLQQAGFKHNTVYHTYNFVDPNTGAHTRDYGEIKSVVELIEIFWNHIWQNLCGEHV